MKTWEVKKTGKLRFMLSKFIKDSILGFTGGKWETVSRKLSYNGMKLFGS